MQGILSRPRYLAAALLVVLLALSLAACDTNGITDGTNGTNGDATPQGEEGIDTGQEVPGSEDGGTPGTAPGTAIQPGEGVTGTGTVEPTGEVGQDADAREVADCFEADPHPIGEAIAEDFDAGYDEVMGWMCDGFSFEDILLALQTSELSGRPAGEILDKTGSRSWSLIWQEAGLTSSGPRDGDGADQGLDGDSQETTATPAPGGDDATPVPRATAIPGGDDATPAPRATAAPGGDDATPAPRGTPAPGRDDATPAPRTTATPGEDGALRWTGDEFELTGTVAHKDEATRTIDVRARNEEGVEQIYAFDVGDNEIFEEVEVGDGVRVSGERLEDGTVVAYEMQALSGPISQDGDDNDADAQDRPGAGLAPGELEFRGTIAATDPDERSFELQATRTYTFYVPEGLSFDAFGVGAVIEVEVEPLDDASLSADDSATGDDGSTRQDMDDGLDGNALADAWRVVEFELVGTVEAVDDAAGTIEVVVRHDGEREETHTFDMADDNLREYYRVGGGVEIEVQLEATAAEMGRREVLNGDQDGGLAPGAGDDDAGDGADAGESLFLQEPVGLGAGEFELRGTIVSVDEAANSFDLRPDARYAVEMGGPEIITGTDAITGTGTLTGTNGLDASEGVTGTNGTAGEGQLETYTFYLPPGLGIASVAVGDVIEVEIEPAATGGLFERDGTGTDEGTPGAGDDQDARSQEGQAQPEGATAFASFELMGEVVAMDGEAGTIDVRLIPPDDVTGTNGLTTGDGSGGRPTAGITSTETMTRTGDAGDDVAPPDRGQAEEIYVFYIADVAARRYYSPGTVVEIEIDLEERAGRGSADGDAGQFCAGVTGEHPLAAGIAETYGAGVDEIRGWYCEDGLGFGEIMLALTTARASGEPADELAARRVAGEGWGEIWQDLDLIDDVQDAGEMNDRLGDD